MNIWIVNPFDPLPGDPEQEGRYATLAHQLVARGHAVTWWTRVFSHRFKRPVDQAALTTACTQAGIRVRFTDVPPYQRNVSLQRLHSHRILARRFFTEGLAEARETRPDIIVVSSPPPSLAWRAVQIAHAVGARSIIDIQDLWPNVFASLVPPGLRPLLQPGIYMLRHTVRRVARGCDAIVGVADAYVQSSARETHPGKRLATIPLGVDLAAFDAAAAAGKCAEFTKPAGERWLAYTGSLNRSYDCLTILRAAAELRERAGRLRFFITSRGELAGEAARLVREHKLTNVTLTGFLDFAPWAYLLSQCDVGFNASFPHVMIYLPNKIFYYFAAGAAVLNTIPGQCSRIVRDGHCGRDYRAGDAADCAAAIAQVVGDASALDEMRRASRQLAQSVYDRALLYRQYADLIETVAREK